jgi:hypothetical protein
LRALDAFARATNDIHLSLRALARSPTCTGPHKVLAFFARGYCVSDSVRKAVSPLRTGIASLRPGFAKHPRAPAKGTGQASLTLPPHCTASGAGVAMTGLMSFCPERRPARHGFTRNDASRAAATRAAALAERQETWYYSYFHVRKHDPRADDCLIEC